MADETLDLNGRDEEVRVPISGKMAGQYEADNIQVLEGLEAVRKRPAMYIGDVGVRGLHHLVYEVVDNSIDEALAGYCDRVEVTIHEDNSISVWDNGRGIPVGIHKKENRPAVEVVMTVLHAGGKFDKDTYKVSGGLHGVGVSCVNALSDTLDVTIRREGFVWQQTYEKGTPVTPLQKLRPMEPDEETGTHVHFWPDDSHLPRPRVPLRDARRPDARAGLPQPGITITIEDRREDDEELGRETYHCDGGLKEFVEYLDEAREAILEDTIFIEGDNGDVPIELAMRYNAAYTENVLSFVNNINTHEGGTHISGFRRALTRTLKTYADKNGLLKNVKIDLSGDDFREGTDGRPQREGAGAAVRGADQDEARQLRGAGRRREPRRREAGGVARRPPERREADHPEGDALSAQARAAARKARELVQRKNAFGGGRPPRQARRLRLARTRPRARSSSSRATPPAARRSRPATGTSRPSSRCAARSSTSRRRGSTRSSTTRRSRTSSSRSATGLATGVENGEFNADNLRYHKIVLMTDADVDGAHIRTLLLTLIYRYLRPLIERGLRLHRAAAALPRQEGQGGALLLDRRASLRRSWPTSVATAASRVQRYKGLGEMNPEQLWDTTMNPETRDAPDA